MRAPPLVFPIHIGFGRIALAVAVVGGSSVISRAADAGSLYGIHWWGYTQGTPIDTTPASLLSSATYGGWDVETILTHSGVSWWSASYFAPLYQDLHTNKNITVASRIDYNWGETVPAPTTLSASAWAPFIVSAVNSLKAGCHIWIVGNECNLNGEATHWPGSQITPSGYATIYRAVRTAVHTSAQSSPAGAHLVLIAPPSPGGIVSGVRWMAGTDWLGQVIDNIPANEIDGFALHSYGGTITDFHTGYVDQLNLIDSKGHADKPAYITEWNHFATAGNAGEEATAAQFCRDAFADVNAWNADPCHHNVISMSWFVYDADQQASGGWNGYSIEYWKNNGNPSGNAGDLYTAFQDTVGLHYQAGATGTAYLSSPMLNQTPPGTNVALQSVQVLTDSNNLPSQSGARAIDGVVASTSKWCSGGAAPPHWLALDLGSSRNVTGFIVRHAQAGGETATFNTQGFFLQSASSMNGPWTNEAAVCNSAQTASFTTLKFATPKALRYVRLYVIDPGIDNFARIPEFEVYEMLPPVAGFTGSPLAGKLPLTVSFTDQSTGTPASWTWTLGDGATSTLRNPSHTYSNVGMYTVALTVTNAIGNDTLTRTNYVTVRSYGCDFDHDNDVDLSDFAHFQNCLTGAIPQNDPNCQDAKLDSDAFVGSADLDIFINCISGTNVVASTNCR